MNVPSVAPRRQAPIVEPPAPAFEPIRLLETELRQPMPDLAAIDEKTGRGYRRAMVLVRLHAQPLGWIEVKLSDEGLTAAAYAREIWHALGSEINAHLRRDGLPEVSNLRESGLSTAGTPACMKERERFLADAPFASVIVPTSERSDRLALCLRSLLAMEYPHFEIIVVDNVPKTAATFNLIRGEFGDSLRVRYVREDRSGSAAARNRGLAVARGEIVAFTDDDVVVDRYWLAEMAKGFSVADNVACVTGLILPLELETPAQLWFEQYGGFSKGFIRRVYDLAENRSDSPLYPFNVGGFGSGNSMAFKKSVLHTLGNFDPTLGNGTPTLGGVDVEAFLRVVVKGYRLVYEPAAIVHHLHRRHYAGLYKQVYSYGVGMTAVLTKSLLANPWLIGEFARKVPAGIRYAVSPHSALHAQKEADYPSELTRLDQRGMLYGPLAYLSSCAWWHLSLPLNRYRRRAAASR